MVIVVLVSALCVSVYRIFDLGVTITYMESSLDRQKQKIAALDKYQRIDCLGGEQLIDFLKENFEPIEIFEKQGSIIIDGFPFHCVSKNGNEVLEYNKDYSKTSPKV